MRMVNPDIGRQAWHKQLARYAPYIMVGLLLSIVPGFMPAYLQSIMTKIIIYGILAMGLQLLWGYTGLFSIGHAAYFGAAAYTAAILTVNYGIESFWFAAVAGILVAGLIAAFFGVVALRASRVYFMLITLALGELLYSVALKWRTMTGGSDGLVGIPYPDLGLPWLTMNSGSLYYLVFVAFGIIAFLLYRLVNSPFGHILEGIRENEARMRALGYNTWMHKYIGFVVGGLIAGAGGVLLGYYSGIVVPSHVGIKTSVLAMLMVILGGERSFLGPLLGAVIIVLLEYFTSLYTPQRWPLVLGSVFVLSVMFLRGGITIYLSRLWKRMLLTWKL